MTYSEYIAALSSPGQNYAALFDSEENKEKFAAALKAGGEAIKAIEELPQKLEEATSPAVDKRC